MATPRKPGARRGRPKTDPESDSWADILADILALIPRDVRPGWNEVNWSSSHYAAIQKVVQELNPDIPIPKTPDPMHRVRNHRGRWVNTVGYFSSLRNKLESLGPSYAELKRDPSSPKARVMMMAYNRRWLHYAGERLQTNIEPDVLSKDLKTAGLIVRAAGVHNDTKTLERLAGYLEKARRSTQRG